MCLKNNFKMKFFALALAYIIFANISPSFCDNNDTEKTYRLPTQDLSVISYELRVIPNLEPDLKFKGEVSITIYPYTYIQCFMVNSKNLEITKIQARYRSITYAVTHELIPEREMLKICVSPSFSRYNYVTVIINYEGRINDDFKGLYKIPYNENGSKKWLLATQFEPTYARTVFPCFDEPEYRASFMLTLHVLPSQDAIGVTDVISRQVIDNREAISFRKIGSIPPNLISFAIHEFKTSSANKDSTITMVSRKRKPEYTQFFITQIQGWLRELEKYTGIAFKANRLFTLAAPDADEYSRKAGLIVYKESDAFFVDGVDAEKHTENIAKVAIHKLTHLWFHMVVVHRWWDNTWLSESFATFFEYLISGQVEPKWRMEENFIPEVLQAALFDEENYYDTSLSSPTGALDEIQYQKFNPTINKKGASIIRMLQYIVTNTHFQSAIHRTLVSGSGEYNQGVIEPKDLWTRMQNEIYQDQILPRGVTIQDVMDTWIKNLAYPLVKVSKTPQGAVIVEQEEYESPRSIRTIPKQTWIIPITCTKQSSVDFTKTKPQIWSMSKGNQTADITLKDKEWIVCNLQQAGYYRVIYDEQNWALLTDQLKSDPNIINVKNRAQLVDDSFHFAISEKLNFLVPLKLGGYLKNENDPLPWLSIIKYVNHLVPLYERTTINEYLKYYFRGIFQPVFQKIGFSKISANETYSWTRSRSVILDVACNSLEMQECTTKAIEIYNYNANNITKIPADQKYVVYCSLFKTSKHEENTWNNLWSIFVKSDTMSERELILKSLACASDQQLLKKYISMTLKPTDHGLYNSEKDVIVNSIARSIEGVTATLNMIEEVTPQLSTLSQDTVRTLITLTNRITNRIQSMEHLTKLKQIIAKMETNNTKNALLQNTLKQSHARGLKNIEYRDKHGDEIKKAIYTVTGYVPTPPTTLPPPTKFPTMKPQSTSVTSKNDVTTKAPNAPSNSNYLSPITAPVIFTFGLLVKYILI